MHELIFWYKTYPHNANRNCFQADQTVVINKGHQLDVSKDLSFSPQLIIDLIVLMLRKASSGFYHDIDHEQASYQLLLTRPMKNRTATSPDRTAMYCIQDLLNAIRRSKLFPVEKTPTSNLILLLGIDGAFNCSASSIKSWSSETGKPLANTDMRSKPPFTLTPSTDHGSSFCIQYQMS